MSLSKILAQPSFFIETNLNSLGDISILIDYPGGHVNFTERIGKTLNLILSDKNFGNLTNEQEFYYAYGIYRISSFVLSKAESIHSKQHKDSVSYVKKLVKLSKKIDEEHLEETKKDIFDRLKHGSIQLDKAFNFQRLILDAGANGIKISDNEIMRYNYEILQIDKRRPLNMHDVTYTRNLYDFVIQSGAYLINGLLNHKRYSGEHPENYHGSADSILQIVNYAFGLLERSCIALHTDAGFWTDQRAFQRYSIQRWKTISNYIEILHKEGIVISKDYYNIPTLSINSN